MQVVEAKEVEFWAKVDQVFEDLDDPIGFEDGNLWWFRGVADHTEEKLVLQAARVSGAFALEVHLLLEHFPEVFAGAKLMVHENLLLILYLMDGAEVGAELLDKVAATFDAVPFVPFNHSVCELARVWVGSSAVADSFCQPLLH